MTAVHGLGATDSMCTGSDSHRDPSRSENTRKTRAELDTLSERISPVSHKSASFHTRVEINSYAIICLTYIS